MSPYKYNTTVSQTINSFQSRSTSTRRINKSLADWWEPNYRKTPVLIECDKSAIRCPNNVLMPEIRPPSNDHNIWNPMRHTKCAKWHKPINTSTVAHFHRWQPVSDVSLSESLHQTTRNKSSCWPDIFPRLLSRNLAASLLSAVCRFGLQKATTRHAHQAR